MSNITFTNFAATTLNTGINSSVTSLVVSSGTGALFPSLVGSQYFYCTLVDAATGTTREIVKVTARSTDTFTIVRGQESTSSSSYLAGDKVELRLTAAGINTFATTETAQTFVGNQTISGTLTATTIGAFTLSGTVSGGGNQLNNVIIGTTTPLAGAFTTLSATGLITGRSTNGQVFAATNSSNSSFSLDISSAKVTFSQLASAGTLDTIIDSTIRTSISSTGLAVTGTLSSTSTISSTKISGAWIQNVSATTGAAYYAQTNTAGSLYLGVESSTGGSIMSGTTAYASVFGTDNNKPVQIVSNNAVVGSFSSTGLAVTGDISLPTTNQLGWGASPFTCAIEGASGASGYIRFATNNAFRMLLDSSGIVTMNAYGAGAATFSAAGVISSVSDETWKVKDGAPVDTDAMLNKLEPGYWYYNDEKKETFGKDRQLGFYAQNVNAAIGPEAAPEPETVTTKNDDGTETSVTKPWGYYDRSVLAVTVMSLQKALATIESLTARITALENK